jgi:hypothetical protein
MPCGIYRDQSTGLQLSVSSRDCAKNKLANATRQNILRSNLQNTRAASFLRGKQSAEV